MRAQRDGWKAEAEGHAAESALRETSVLKQQAEIVDLKVLDGRHVMTPPSSHLTQSLLLTLPLTTIPSLPSRLTIHSLPLPSTAPQAALKNLEESRVTEKSQLTEAVSAAREAAIALKRSQREASSSFQKGLAVREEYEASLSKEVCSRSQAKQAHCNHAHLPILLPSKHSNQAHRPMLLLFSCVCALLQVSAQAEVEVLREKVADQERLLELSSQSDSEKVSRMRLEMDRAKVDCNDAKEHLATERERAMEAVKAKEAAVGQLSGLQSQLEEVTSAKTTLEDEVTLVQAKLMRARREFQAAEGSRLSQADELNALRQQVSDIKQSTTKHSTARTAQQA